MCQDLKKITGFLKHVVGKLNYRGAGINHVCAVNETDSGDVVVGRVSPFHKKRGGEDLPVPDSGAKGDTLFPRLMTLLCNGKIFR